MALIDGLESFWELGEATGLTREDSHGSNDLTPINNPEQIAGKVGNAVHLTLADEEALNIADNASISTGDIDFTLAGWVYFDSAPGAITGHTIVAKWNSTDGDFREYIVDWIGSAGGDRFRWVVSTTGADAVLLTANTFGAPSTGAWIFWAVWHDATANELGARFGTGGTLSAAETPVSHSGGVFDSTATFWIGQKDLLGVDKQWLDGSVDQVGFWKRVLTPEEIVLLFNGGAGLSYAEVVAGGPIEDETILQSEYVGNMVVRY